MLDCYGCAGERLTDLDLVYEALDTCPGEIGMTKIMPPYVFRYRGKVADEWGVSGVVLIAESHITIHTFPEKGYVTIDIFSCKAFDVDRALELFRHWFRPDRVEHRVVGRGMEYPRDLNTVAEMVRAERFEHAPAFMEGVPEPSGN